MKLKKCLKGIYVLPPRREARRATVILKLISKQKTSRYLRVAQKASSLDPKNQMLMRRAPEAQNWSNRL